jgi:peptidoglycan hydrolase CwlO-like protein
MYVNKYVIVVVLIFVIGISVLNVFNKEHLPTTEKLDAQIELQKQLDDTLASLNDSIMQLQYLLDIKKNNIEKHKTKADENVKRINNFTDDELLRFITKRYQR